jgi:hypothetical protein
MLHYGKQNQKKGRDKNKVAFQINRERPSLWPNAFFVKTISKNSDA